MKFLQKHKWKFVWGIVVAGILIAAFWWGGNAPELEGFPVSTEIATEAPTEELKVEASAVPSTDAPTVAPKATPTISVTTPPTEKPIEKNICTLSVRCDTILNNMNYLDAAKIDLVPSNGIIYATGTASFNEGESVFDVLRRELQSSGIHMEFEKAPMYNSVYIEGIANIYEFDCGERSGWLYRVNGVVPQVCCSQYKVEKGDRIEFIYTCEAGNDIG